MEATAIITILSFLAWYLLLSAVTLCVFAWDKGKAKSGGWRVSEMNLCILGLLGGWPGGFLAIKCLRHKTQKSSFQCKFGLAVAGNLALLAALILIIILLSTAS